MSLDQRIIPVNIEDEMKSAYIDYSMSVIVSRALPDVRDGLKPVQRRVMYGMSDLGVTYNKAHKKSARIVGEVLGKYHPHGDTSVYDTMVRMAQDWSLRYPLIDPQGNFGNIDGDGPAAMRYTEARMRKITDEMLADIDKDTVDFANNFDDTLKEPTVMPTRFPNLLVNGATGIAVGMATNMMPHNLSEVIDGVIATIDDPEITIDDLMKHILAPDFPTGGIIYGMSAYGLASRLGIPPAEGRSIIDAYFAQYPGIRQEMERLKEEARTHGFVRTPFGRKLWIPDIATKDPVRRAGAERAAINAPFQGGAAEIIKRAMVRLPRALREAGLSARMLLQVHDELVFEVPVAEVEATSAVVKRIMESVATLRVPLSVEIGTGHSWAEAH
jgi:hypothetical protein